jgi:hypothetical protein
MGRSDYKVQDLRLINLCTLANTVLSNIICYYLQQFSIEVATLL